MKIARTKKEWLRQIAIETARMSYPSAMSRGKRPVVKKATKSRLEEYFSKSFARNDFWKGADRSYDDWHYARSQAIGNAIRDCTHKGRNPCVVAAKFLDTFMHQLMKYGRWRGHWQDLHLPIDSKVFSSLRGLKEPAFEAVQGHFFSSPYDLRYDQYLAIQEALWDFVKALNSRRDPNVTITSRIELNWLWL